MQCVSSARVTIDGVLTGSIGRGYLVLLGVGRGDDEAAVERLWRKILNLRILEDEDGKTNLSLRDVSGEVMVVSQFTLYANARKGNRPSFTDAMPPQEAERLYGYFTGLVKRDLGDVATGRFGETMDVELVNHGPFTLLLDTEDR